MRCNVVKNNRFFSLLLGVGLACASGSLHANDELRFGTPEEAGMSSARIHKVAEDLQQLVDDERLAGMVTIGARHGKIVHYETMGYQDIETKTPMAKDSIFRAFSLSKP